MKFTGAQTQNIVNFANVAQDAQNSLSSELTIYKAIWKDFELDLDAKSSESIGALDSDILSPQITKFEYLTALAVVNEPEKEKTRDRVTRYMAQVSSMSKQKWEDSISPMFAKYLQQFLDKDKKKGESTEEKADKEKKEKKDKKEKKEKKDAKVQKKTKNGC